MKKSNYHINTNTAHLTSGQTWKGYKKMFSLTGKFEQDNNVEVWAVTSDEPNPG